MPARYLTYKRVAETGFEIVDVTRITVVDVAAALKTVSVGSGVALVTVMV